MAIRLGGHLPRGADDDYPRFLMQFGVTDVFAGYGQSPAYDPALGDDAGMAPYWSTPDLIRLRQRCEAAGLRLLGLENPVPPWRYDRIMLGLPGRDAQIEHYMSLIRQMADAQLFVLGYHWMANAPGVARASFRTELGVSGRGGAGIEAFDLNRARDIPPFRGRLFSEAEMWANYTYFIRAVVPVAEEVGVRLALHPDDPPITRLGGIPRLFHDVAGFQRAMEIASSSASGLNFCLGNWTAMGADIPAAVRHFGGQGHIVLGHVQGVTGTVPSFRECFLDEADCDFLGVFRALNEIGFDGVMIPGHFPKTVNDPAPQRQGQAFAFGYVKALIQASEAPSPIRCGTLTPQEAHPTG